MRAYILCLAASLAFPILGAPLPLNQEPSREANAIERRLPSSLHNLFLSVVKRNTVVESFNSIASPNDAIVEPRAASDGLEKRINRGNSGHPGKTRDLEARINRGNSGHPGKTRDLEARINRGNSGHPGKTRDLEARINRGNSGHPGKTRDLEARINRGNSGHPPKTRDLEARKARGTSGHGGNRRSIVERAIDYIVG